MKKQHILDEIKRTASANGGVPLGGERLFSETGIKSSDWRGKYWARWSDAVIEAGFEPNELNSAYEETEVFEQLARLTRKYGKYPTNAEMRLERRSNSAFPSDGVIGRFGRKDLVVGKLRDFCKGNSEFDDVLDLLGNAAIAQEPVVDERRAAKDGYVYLIKSGKHYKIGFTNDMARRSKEITLELPERHETIHVITTDDPPGIEAYWHQRFKDKRGNGEWFLLSATDVKVFRRRKFM